MAAQFNGDGSPYVCGHDEGGEDCARCADGLARSLEIVKGVRARLRRKPDECREDRLHQLLDDNLADLIKAAEAEGFTRDELRAAVYRGAFNGWAEVRGAKIGDIEGEQEGTLFADSVGSGV